MSNIKVCVRARPALPGEYENGKYDCLEMETGSEASIRIKKDGESKRFFSRVWGPDSTQEEIFKAVGVPSVLEVFEGFYATIFVYGQTGTGKTFTLGCTLPGLEGIQPRAIDMIFDKINAERHLYDAVVHAEYIQLYRDSVLDLLDLSRDKLGIKIDPKIGALVQGASRVEVTSAERLHALVQQGNSNRATANTKLNSSSSRSHACLIISLTRRSKTSADGEPEETTGKLYLIDLAGSERVSKSGATGAAFSEAVAINKSLTVLGTCVYGLVNGEKHIPFRDSKLTRILQHSLQGNGRTTVIVTVQPSSEHMSETQCTLKFGERAMKVQAQMTVGDYKEQQAERYTRLAQQQETIGDRQSEVRTYRKLSDDLDGQLRGVQAECDEKEAANSAELQALAQKIAEENKVSERRYEEQLQAQKKKYQNQIAQLRQLNSDRLAAAEAKQKEAAERLAQQTEEFKEEQDQRLNVLRKRVEELKAQPAVEVPDEAAIKEKLEAARQRVSDLKYKIRDCTVSKNSGLTLQQLRAKLVKLKGQRRSLGMKLRDLKELKEEQDEQKALAGTMSDSDRTVTASDMTSSPPASQSDSGSTDTSSSDSDTDSSSSSSSSSESVHKKPQTKPSNEVKEQEEDIEELFSKIEMRNFRRARNHFQKLNELIENILVYLDHGTTVTRIVQNKPPVKTRMFFRKGRTVLSMNDCDSGDPTEMVRLKDVKEIILGQYTEGFKKHAPERCDRRFDKDREGVVDGKTLEKSKEFHRSFSIRERKKQLDIIAENEQDFEAWVMALHRLAMTNPKWGDKTDISELTGVEKLTPAEHEVCSENHILPSELLDVRENILEQDLLYTSLYQIRTTSVCDLLHSQILFEFFVKQKWVVAHRVHVLLRVLATYGQQKKVNRMISNKYLR
eukprot:Sspe_Gene.12136::Locus_4130_Transcript_1_1_Confidence_1.000_Length_2847::g.12136::m.12136/K10396/KIF5; kinesin family member 5